MSFNSFIVILWCWTSDSLLDSFARPRILADVLE